MCVHRSAAIFAEDGKMLLVNRSDGYGWGLPGGFCEVYEGPEETIVREVREETGIEVRVEAFIQIFQRLAGEFGIPSPRIRCSITALWSVAIRPRR